MPWPIPAPGAIAARAASLFEQILPGIDARSDNTVATALTRVAELSAQDLYFFLGYLAQQLLPNTATDWLPLHGAIWRVPQDQPVAASGNAVFTGAAGANIPIGVSLTAPSGAFYATTGAASIGASGSASIPVAASVAGSAGNLPAGTVLTIVSPIANISPQTALVDAGGLTGGLDLESLDSWRARIDAKIGTEPSGGSVADYIEWAKAAIPGVAYAACPASMAGAGTVGVVIAMAGPAAPTPSEIAAVQAYINTLRPVTAAPTVYGAVLNPVNIALQVRPNTAAVQAAAQQALALFFSQSAVIGGPTYLSQLNAALSSADGEIYHELLSPTADVAAPQAVSLNVLGSVVFS